MYPVAYDRIRRGVVHTTPKLARNRKPKKLAIELAEDFGRIVIARIVNLDSFD